ncbi:MAG: hypothetical protein PHX80_04025 [Candidatus Nanoarchaeia archaeon]|nr:hypothetical protein [Candidatus Nanoarchaeia archaeon]
MARPERHDVDYFPFLVKDGRTLFILESKYDLEGIGFFTNLFRFLSQRPDHHFCISDPCDKLFFFSKIKCKDEVKGLDMLDIMATTGKINKQLWEEKRAIASEDFLLSIADAYKDRKNTIITINDIFTFYGVCLSDNLVTLSGNTPVAEFPLENEGDNTQTKLKETKLKDTKQFYLAELLFKLHKEQIDQKYKVADTHIESWANDIRLIHEKDEREWEEIESVIRWVKTPGQFWAPNIMSGKKLREQFSRLISQMKLPSKNTNKGNNNLLYAEQGIISNSETALLNKPIVEENLKRIGIEQDDFFNDPDCCDYYISHSDIVAKTIQEMKSIDDVQEYIKKIKDKSC